MPNLDDRRWADLTEEGRALVPLYAPEWTDHNASDPGITLVELFAWLVEMDIYRLNHVPETHRRKFLKLVGIEPAPPKPARTVLTFSLKTGATATLLPAETEASGADPFGQITRFRTLQAVKVLGAQLQTVQWYDGQSFHDLTRRWCQGKPVAPFGDNPKPGMAFYLGLDSPLAVGEPANFYFVFNNDGAGEEERQELISQVTEQEKCCRAQDRLLWCGESPHKPKTHVPPALPPHHCARTAWEFYAGPGDWRMLSQPGSEVSDDTRSFTLNGGVVIKLASAMSATRLGWDEQDRFYLRCRFVAGAFDAAPQLTQFDLKAVAAEQAVYPNLPSTVPFTFAGQKLQGEQLGLEDGTPYVGDGTPDQQVFTSQHPVLPSSFQLFTVINAIGQSWELRPDFDASKPADRHFLFDPTSGKVTFGDGNKGQVVPAGALVVAKSNYLATRAQDGNLTAETIDTISANQVTVTNHVAATGGSAVETLQQAEARAVKQLNAPTRAVTLADYEWFAQNTPGVRIARVAAKANVHPAFPCLNAPGLITVCVLPFLPADKPLPSSGLLKAVACYLRGKRVIGTRVEVCGPTYMEVAVQAQVQGRKGVNATSLAQEIVSALNAFFHPIHGGPEDQGWPFGREVFRSEVLAVIDQTEGVDHVLSLALVATDGTPQCGNICVGFMGLVAPGQHRIQVLS